MDEKKKISGEEFIEAVCAKVRFTPARERIADELRGHLEDRAAMLEEHGVPPEDAAQRAAASMGDPAEIGAALDQEHSPFWGWAAMVSGILCAVILVFAVLAAGISIIFRQNVLLQTLSQQETLFYTERSWTMPWTGERQEEIPLGELHETEDSWIWVDRAQVSAGGDLLTVTLHYRTWHTNPLMPGANDIWCWRVRDGDAVLAERDSRWEAFEQAAANGAPPEVLTFDFVSAAGGRAFAVLVPIGPGGEPS